MFPFRISSVLVAFFTSTHLSVVFVSHIKLLYHADLRKTMGSFLMVFLWEESSQKIFYYAQKQSKAH